MYKRAPFETLLARLKESRKFIQVIMGPRQVGKTTMVQQLLPYTSSDYIFESADAMASNHLWLEQIWESARLKTGSGKNKECLLVLC